ncbi:MAG: glycosyltransferase family 2 protein, partial [Eubacterium sp.]|nr:glycosyltransferase family 2 protein [Eubacterium sp.]
MRVSVIIPFRTELKFLQDALNSLEAQTCKDFEAVVVCAGSSDQDIEFVKNYQCSFPIQVVVLPEAKGVGHARNKGIEAAKGEYILFLDCDDYLEDIAIEWLLERVQGHDIVMARKKNTRLGRIAFLEKREKARLEGKEEEPENETSEEGEDGTPEQEDHMIPEVHEHDAEWIKCFSDMVRANFNLTGISILGIMMRRQYILDHQIRFREEMYYNTDLTFFTALMKDTDKVIL